MEHPIIKAAGGSLAVAVEAIHLVLRFLVERWSTDSGPVVVRSPDILEMRSNMGWMDIGEDVCYAISSELDQSNFEPDRDLIFPVILKRLLPASAPEQDVKYYFMRSIRRRYHLEPSAATVRALHAVALIMSPFADLHGESPVPYDEFVETIRRSSDSDTVSRDVPRAYCDLCWALDRVKVAGRGLVTLQPEVADAEHLMSHLFGVPTGIPGFDDLFGGGGLMLADSMASGPVCLGRQDSFTSSADPGIAAVEVPKPPPLMASALRKLEGQGIGGRVVLVIGTFGSGKSLLSLQMAVEVARKGGVAWVMSLEQTDEECEYSLESIGISTKHPSMRVYRGPIESLHALTVPVRSQGALVFLRPEPSGKTDFGSFLENVQQRLEWMSEYPLRLLVIDPVNAVGQPRLELDSGLRTKTHAMFEAAKHQNVNVWFTSEQPTGHALRDRFEENVADTVIRLGVDEGTGRRYIEITKSRFQHEYSGRHALAIEPQTGKHVYPPASMIARSVRNDGLRKGSALPYECGVAGMDQLLGPNAPLPGDLIVLAGPGKGKTLLGVQFLTSGLENDRLRNLFISDYNLQRIGRFVETATRRGDLAPVWDNPGVVRCSIQAGFGDPSRVLLQIRRALDKCSEGGCSPSRVLVTNLSRWEKEMPPLGGDVSFGIALSKLLRSYGVVTIVVNGDELEHDSSPLRQTMASQADTLIHFQRREFKGRVTTLVTTIKSRLMRHPRESFELIVEADQLRIGPAPLFRANSAGDLTPVKVVLYLHAETPNHKRYNAKILAALRTTLSPDTHIASQTLRYDPEFLSKSQYSAVDELQVFQLDEYQLPPAGSMTSSRVLHTFDLATHCDALASRLPSLTRRVICDEGKRFFAVPFYQNGNSDF